MTDYINGARLNEARVSNATLYRELIEFYKQRGATEGDLIRAMAAAPCVRPLKVARSPKPPKVKRPRLPRIVD